jgi:hypothetical protein
MSCRSICWLPVIALNTFDGSQQSDLQANQAKTFDL